MEENITVIKTTMGVLAKDQVCMYVCIFISITNVRAKMDKKTLQQLTTRK